MLPSRGLSRSNPVAALRATKSARTQTVRPLQIPIRHFSQAQSRSILSCRSGIVSSTLISSIGSRTVLAATASSVFAQRSGASRNLSLWPFSKSKSPAETEAAPASSAEAPEPVEPVAPVESLEQQTPVSSAADQIDLSSAQPSTISMDNLDTVPILDIPEQIGYLKHLGLEFWWGPTATCEWLVEHLYIYTGMPWWAVLATMALAFRVAFFVPTLKSSKHQALLQKLATNPEYLQAKAEFEEAVYKTRDPIAQQTARSKLMAVKSESGASTMKSLAMLWSFPFSWGMFRLLRNMAAIPVPSLETGGMLWFTDLTVHDPYYIIPFSSVALTVLMFKQNQAASLTPQTEMARTIQKGMLYFVPPTMFLATAWLPAGLQWFFLMFSVSSVIQSAATLNPAVRRWAGIPPLPTGPRGTANEAGITYQAPTSPFSRSDAAGPSAKKGMMSSLLNTPENERREQWRKAQEYEERRAAEDREKLERRMEEILQKRAQKRAQKRKS
ncbi:60Kd inner membrane protein-domain-containing protein [Rostrohypoxylon terebratum]|nr:60Kd inner membrane protein-domain-containing protein [Rostrohypoxylon terebratum]